MALTLDSIIAFIFKTYLFIIIIVKGDQERKQLQITPPASMDREREHELPQLQMRWIHDICLPLYQVTTDLDLKALEANNRDIDFVCFSVSI